MNEVALTIAVLASPRLASRSALLRNSHIPNLLLNNNKSISLLAQSQLSTAIGNPFIYMTCHACSPQQPHGRLARMKSRRPSVRPSLPLPPFSFLLLSLSVSPLLAHRPADRPADL